ncbi:hypothetical protein ACSBR1_014395 [Camellia fascicularis]
MTLLLKLNQMISCALPCKLVYEAPHPSALAKLDSNLKRAGRCRRYGILTTCQLQHDAFLDEEWRATFKVSRPNCPNEIGIKQTN